MPHHLGRRRNDVVTNASDSSNDESLSIFFASDPTINAVHEEYEDEGVEDEPPEKANIPVMSRIKAGILFEALRKDMEPRIKFLIDNDTLETKYRRARSKLRKRVPWRPAEFKALLKGIKLYGERNWDAILESGKGIFHVERRKIDLIDKYRQYRRKSSFHMAKKRCWAEVKPNEAIADCQSNEQIKVYERFPFNAAIRIARRRIREAIKPTNNFIIRIYDVNEPVEKHTYNVSKTKTELKIKKMSKV